MTLPIYPLADGKFSFQMPSRFGGEPTAVKVPAGSQLLPTRIFGLQLFVPDSDNLARYAFSANQIMKEALRDSDRFVIVTGPLATCSAD